MGSPAKKSKVTLISHGKKTVQEDKKGTAKPSSVGKVEHDTKEMLDDKEGAKDEASAPRTKKDGSAFKVPAPVRFFVVVVVPGKDGAPDELQEHEAQKKSELFQKLDELGDPKFFGPYRGRKISLRKKFSYKIQ